MNINVKKNAKRNIVFGTINRMIAVACPFITRTVLQYTLGKEYLGLGSLFNSILTILSLSELGLSEAIVYSMYKPVAEDDTSTVNSLLNFYKRTYRYIGITILLVGCILIPFLPHLISEGCPPNINLTLLFMIYVVNSSLSYFLYAYANSLIVVYQRSDLSSKINSAVTLLLTVSQVLCLILYRNYMAFALLMPLFTVINNLRIALVVKKMFPQYKCEGKISDSMRNDLKEKIKGTIIARLCGVSRNSFDNITTSAFLGLAVTAMYGNYYYIIAAVYSFMSIISTALVGGIGNHSVTRSSEQNYAELKKIDFLYMWIAGWCSVCILCLIQPFIELWMGKEMMLSFPVVIMLVVYFYSERTIDMKGLYISAQGLWDRLKIASLCEAILNIVLNVVLGKIIGLYGIILATISTIFFINNIWKTQIVFHDLFGKSKEKDYYLYHLKYFFITVFAASLSYVICQLVAIDGILLKLIYRLFICAIIPNCIYFIFYHNTKCYKEATNLVFRK